MNRMFTCSNNCCSLIDVRELSNGTMLIPFFYLLRSGGVKTSITELLMLLEALKLGVAGHSVDDFYYLARSYNFI